MKITYSRQITVCAVMILLFNLLTTLLKHWVWHSIGWCLCGLLWVINPVMIHDKVPTKKEKIILQIMGCIVTEGRSIFYFPIQFSAQSHNA